jgi:hypothetical protein
LFFFRAGEHDKRGADGQQAEHPDGGGAQRETGSQAGGERHGRPEGWGGHHHKPKQGRL